MHETKLDIPPKRARKWVRLAIYLFAAVGLLFSVLIGVAAFGKKEQPVLSFDGNEVVEKVMARNYGKYSETHRGWLYVDEATKLTYLVNVVQQKNGRRQGGR